jgi:hypothetical protein
MRTPLLRRYKRISRLVYPLSATIRLGNRRGLPHLGRLTAPLSISCSNTVTSCCWPGVSTNVIGLPAPSHRTCTLVENPPWLLPNASVCGPAARSIGSLFLHQCVLPLLRADVLARWCYLRSGRPILSSLRHLPVAVALRGCGPTLLPLSNGRSDLILSSKSLSVQASLAREHQSLLSRVCRSARFASRCLGGLLSVSAVVRATVAAPTAHRLVHVFFLP